MTDDWKAKYVITEPEGGWQQLHDRKVTIKVRRFETNTGPMQLVFAYGRPPGFFRDGEGMWLIARRAL
jgi:hypothetical protein